MASEEGLRILLEGEVSSFISAMRAATAAVNDFSSSVPAATSGLGGIGDAANRAARDTQASAEAAARAAAAFADLGRRFQNIDELSDALSTLRRQAAGADSFAGLQEYNRQIQLLEREIGRLRGTGRIDITARFDNAPRITRDIQQTQAALQSFATAARNTNFQFNTLSRAAGPAGQTLNRFRTQTGNAGGALIGLSRIAQDAPFGFIAIQNNLTELFGAFQQLSRQTGSAGAAFKALGASLLGAGGIGLAFSIITSVMTALIQKYGSLGEAMKAIFGTITEQDKAAKALADTLKGTESEYTKAVVNVNTLRNEIQLAKDGFIDKDKVVKHYNETIGKTTGSVKTLDEAEKALQKNADAYIKFTLLKAAANQALEEAAKKAFKAELERNKTDEQSSDYITSGLAKSKDSSVLALYRKDAAKNREAAAKEAEKDGKVFEDIAKKFSDQAAAISKTFNFDFFGDDKGKKEKKIKTIADVLNELTKSLAATDAQAQLFGISTDNLAKEKLSALNKAFDDLVKLGLKPTSPELKKIAKQIDDISTSIIGVKPLQTAFAQPLGKAVRTTKIKPLSADEFKKMIGIDSQSELKLSPKVKADPVFEEIPALENLDQFAQAFVAKVGQMSDAAKRAFAKNFIVWGDALTSGLTPAIADLGRALQSGLAGALSTIGDSIGQVFAAGGGISNVLNGIINSMSDFIIAFGRQLIEAGTLALIAQKSIVANPYLAIAAGVGAIAIGSALKNSVPHFATGGVVNGPTLAMVGDNPSGVEYMIPKEVMDKFGGGGGAYIADTRISGTDLLIVFKKAEREGRR